MAVTAYEIGQTYFFTYAQLVYSTLFQSRSAKERASAKYAEQLPELAALIVSQGLMQQLTGFQQKKGKNFLNKVEIVAGGRRLDAIGLAIENGQLSPDFPIEVKICTAADARKKSLAENSGREPLSKADQFRSFQALAAEGHTAEELSIMYGTDMVTVKRRLKLANVVPRLFALYEDGQATLDQLMALALTDDHDTQERIWDSLQPYNRNAHQIKALITSQEISTSNNRAAKFVGLNDYEDAGGEVRRDLFSDAGHGYMKDAALLESLAVAKLERLMPMVDQGWAWVDYVTNLDWDELNKFGRIPTIPVPFTEEEQAAYDALQTELEAVQKILRDNEDADGNLSDAEETAMQERWDAADDRETEIIRKMEALEAAQNKPDPAYVAKAGAIVTLEQDATIKVHTGLIRPEDKKQVQQAAAIQRAASGQASTDDDPKATKSPHSEKLTRQLTAHRTAALHVHIAQQPDTALVILAHRLVSSLFDFGCSYNRIESGAQINLSACHPQREGADVAQSKAVDAMAVMKREWEDLLPTDGDSLFAWLMVQEQPLIIKLLAFCTACSVTTIQGSENKNKSAVQLVEAVKLDMADWWEPTKDTYFAQVSKQHTIAIVASQTSPEIAKPLAELKKIPLIEAAEQQMRGKRWLPSILQTA